MKAKTMTVDSGGEIQKGQGLKLAVLTTTTAPTASGGAVAGSVVNGAEEFDFLWDKGAPAGPQTERLCSRLAEIGTLFRSPTGPIMELKPGCAPRFIRDAIDLEAVIRENLKVGVTKKGKLVGNAISSSDLKVLLRSKVLQGKLPIVDRVTGVPTYNKAWALTAPGFNDGADERIFYTGQQVIPKKAPERIREFLSVMFFKSEADRTNALALALTVLLRFRWPGKKPFAAITANKSHAGKDTIVDFGGGNTQRVEISWHYRDWACQNEAVAALVDPNVGVLTIGNIRSGSNVIESSFIERIVTSPKSLMQSSKRNGDGYEREGDFVVCATANNGRFSPDLGNRALPIHLEQIGDIGDRKSRIGDPRHEFLPKFRNEIQAELCGMIEKWKEAGSPLDETVKHPMKEWAATIGGILKVNGFKGFLDNWSLQRSANDSMREALGILAHAAPGNQWIRVGAILKVAVNEGIVSTLMEARHRESERAMERELGVVLTNYRDETLTIETEDGIRAYRIRKDRNQKTGTLATVYMFETIRENKETAGV